ncbi:Serine/threonine-protein phosphatase 2A regulatory subunit B'' subunit gamma [Bagarius yarrelli]|uniref:Serine/threonine-protein phosphatase 2A regulatory subunit B'' subunit gamma n=1 Tax=Bagarius yarrelli TaxID=175774 RepID=A0A556VVR3_BAGYA|nr:Serine/threonine-protein phosphatase 2A regulatory subunit B'' subunit gamma [Bagarius yarrelli]
MTSDKTSHWKDILKRRLASVKNDSRNEEEKNTEETQLFTKYYTEWKGGEKKDRTFKHIPRFYYRLPAEDEVLLQKLREESRAVFLQRKSRELLDNEELQNLWFLLDKHQVAPLSGDEAMISYESFLQLDGLEKSFYSFYVCTAVRKFFFFLDPLRTGKIKIQDILACSFLDDLLEAIQEQMKIHGQEPVSFQDVKGDTVTSILIDLNGFWTYENREVLVTSEESGSADLDDT